MICPKCNGEGAKKSYAYPSILVHKCDGLELKEVATIKKIDNVDVIMPIKNMSFILDVVVLVLTLLMIMMKMIIL